MVAALVVRMGRAISIVLATVVVVSALVRITMPERDRTRGVLAGTGHDVDRILLHFDFGRSAYLPGHPAIATLFRREWQSDIALLIGGVLIGTLLGAALGAWCADRKGSWSAWVLETAATLAFCAPVYVVGYGVLLLFNPTFGAFPLGVFFDIDRPSTLLGDPWQWFQGMLVPWLVVAAPVGGVVLRLTVAGTREALDEEHVRAAVARGLRRRRVVWRYAARASRPQLVVFLSTQTSQLMLNLYLAEYVFSVPGFLSWTKRALGQEDHSRLPHMEQLPPDIPLLVGIAVWTAVLTMAIVVVADLAVVYLDPRTRNRR